MSSNGQQKQHVKKVIFPQKGKKVIDKGEKVHSGQETKKAIIHKGPDGRPLLFGPDINLCKKSKLSG